MSEHDVKDVRELVDTVYRSESRQVLATLIRLLGDFETAEEALHDAFAVAVEQWAREGMPANPQAWLVSTGRFKAIDGIRRRARFDASLTELAKQLETGRLAKTQQPPALIGGHRANTQSDLLNSLGFVRHDFSEHPAIDIIEIAEDIHMR